MTDRNDITRQIEDLLGSEGTHGEAASITEALIENGGITFDPQYGYERSEDFDSKFMQIEESR